ncbi:MAG TPA: ABC transporter permease [Candidatus Acidoferrales bacterium]|nr:ABC transporter permease [Candidatus Acidoferrales bacterium]
MTLTEIKENLYVAVDTLRSRKVRSALTILGIVIGVTSVISVAAIIDGLNGYMQNRIQSFGSRSFFITRIPPGYTGFAPLPQKIRLRKYLEIGDAQYLKETVSGVDIAVAFAQRITPPSGQPDSISYEGERVERMFIRGTPPDYAAAIPLFTVATGRFISDYDESHARAVVVIGNAIAESLFPHSDPIGKQVRLNGKLYEVIGVFEKDTGIFGFGVDQFTCIPLSNFHKNFPEVREVFLIFTVRPDADLASTQNQVVDAMRRRRHVPHNADNDFEVADQSLFLDLWNRLTGAMALLTGVISSIGLLVGGIGVMNIMLISVTERTSEIGVRKAIGARKSDIRAQFLFEAITLSGIGGVLGILIGGAISAVARSLASIPATVSPFWVVAGVGMSVGVGLFFGYYPANRAANLDPIVCLRYE